MDKHFFIVKTKKVSHERDTKEQVRAVLRIDLRDGNLSLKDLITIETWSLLPESHKINSMKNTVDFFIHKW